MTIAPILIGQGTTTNLVDDTVTITQLNSDLQKVDLSPNQTPSKITSLPLQPFNTLPRIQRSNKQTTNVLWDKIT